MATVTDILWHTKAGVPRFGFYMDRWLKENMDGIPYFIEKKYDVVGIISGTGKVRLGKSTLAIQCAYYLAWILAGGKVVLDDDGKVLEIIRPNKKVNFSLDNIVFTPGELKKAAQTFPPNSVIVYDEGRAGLDSSRSMENVNKGMQDFFQECGVYGHVILIVLPDFFQLHRSYAVNRSLFLLNVFADSQFNRGYFSFYNDRQKELLYFWGKKKIGAGFQYAAARRNFWGRFTDFLPFDRAEYEMKKKKALEKKAYGQKEEAMKEKIQPKIALLVDFICNDLSVSPAILSETLQKKSPDHFLSQEMIKRYLYQAQQMKTMGIYITDDELFTRYRKDMDKFTKEFYEKRKRKGNRDFIDWDLQGSKTLGEWNEKIRELAEQLRRSYFEDYSEEENDGGEAEPEIEPEIEIEDSMGEGEQSEQDSDPLSE